MTKKRGFTLIELILAIGIGIIVISLTYNILLVGIKGHSIAFKSFENQSEIRYTIETINNALRFATVGFAVTEDDFQPVEVNGDVEGLVKPWNYIGLGPDKKSIVHYKFVGTEDKKGHYEMEVLAKAFDNLSYNIKFTKPNNERGNKLIRYILEITNDGKREIMTTEVEAINALHVIDWGDAKKPAIALAYRTEETPEIKDKAVAAIAMVLDVSGSMNRDMQGKETINDSKKRISILKNTLTDLNHGLFSILENSEAYISLIPFSTNANIPHNNYKTQIIKNSASDFYNIKEKDKLINIVNDLVADGGTNTGDGLRRAYYQLKKFNEEKVKKYNLDNCKKIKKYIIVLVDGVTTLSSANVYVSLNSYSDWPYRVWYGKFDSFVFNDGNIGDTIYTTNDSLIGYNKLKNGNYPVQPYTLARPVGDGAELDKNYGEEYVKRIGQMILSSKMIDQAFVIGYSELKSELGSVANIARALGIAVKENEENENFKNNDFVFIATNKDELKKAFSDIGGYIKEELWQVEGPRLNSNP